MTDVLLHRDYKGRKGGTIMQNLGLGEATAVENMGIGEILKEETDAPAPAPKAKGEKAGVE